VSASFPISVRTLRVPAAGEGVRFDDVANISEEVAAMLSAFVNGRVRASAYHNTTQNLTTGIETVLNLNSEDFDVGAVHDTVTNTPRLTVPANNGGVYLVIGGSQFAAHATGYRQLNLYKNGGTVLATTVVPVNSGSQVTVCQVAAIVSLAAADYLELAATQNSGGNLSAGSATRSLASFLQIARIW
jgi:hypothetical protein